MAATLVGLSGIAARAQTDEEVSALIAEALLLPYWQNILTATSGTGYKDNVFLSHADPEGAAFVLLSGEFLSFRTAQEGPRVSFFANAEARHYFGNDISHQEYTAFSQAMVEQDFNDTLTASLLGQYYFQDQVLDVSVSETNREAVTVLGHTLSARPTLRVNLPRRLWLELESPVTRQYFDEPLDDYWEAGLKFTFGYKYRRDSQVALVYEPFWRPYDTDPARTATGTAIPNSHRFSFQQNARVVWRHHWDEEKHWRTVMTLGGRINEENGGDYYDYSKWFAAGRIEYHVHGWEISGEARYAGYHYPIQTVSATNPAHRERTEWTASVQIERQLDEKVSVVGSYDYETTGSNDPLETYHVNTVSLSLRWEF